MYWRKDNRPIMLRISISPGAILISMESVLIILMAYTIPPNILMTCVLSQEKVLTSLLKKFLNRERICLITGLCRVIRDTIFWEWSTIFSLTVRRNLSLLLYTIISL